MIQEATKRLVDKKILPTPTEFAEIVGEIGHGATDAQLAALLTALYMMACKCDKEKA